MHLVLFTFEGLNFETIASLNPEENLNTYILDSFAKQSSCFFNFRIPSPFIEENLIYTESVFFKKGISDLIQINPGKLSEDDGHKYVWQHYPAIKKYGNNARSSILHVQESLRVFMEKMPPHRMEDTIFVLVGLSGFDRGDGREKVFNKGINLYDGLIRMPLMIFHPNFSPRNILNSVSLDMVLDFIGDEVCGASSMLGLLIDGKEKKYRADIYTRAGDCFGLRGPMFQYFCRVEEGMAISQELYDLNNDYTMKNDLLNGKSVLPGHIIDLVNVYRDRVLKRKW